jgi:outer membrane receptor protein involved in Fe transport
VIKFDMNLRSTSIAFLCQTLCLTLSPDIVLASDESVDEITVLATRHAVTVDEVSAAITTVAGEEVIDHKLTTDALESLVGVSLQQTTPGQGAVIIRGLKGSAVLHLVDGVRLSNAMFRTAPTPWFALVPVTSVERIEVVRGTPASLYGSEAVGGVVQSVSRLPSFDSDEMEYTGSAAVGLDSAELQKSIRATVDMGTSRLASSFSAEYLSTGDRRVGGGQRVGPSGYESKALRAVVRGTPTDDRSWFVDFHFLEQPETPRIDELAPGFGQTEPSSSEFVFAPNQRLFAHVRHQHTASSGIDWKVDAAWQRIVDDRITRDLGAVDRRIENNRSDLYGLTVNAAGGSDAVSWIVGVDAYYDEVSSARRAQDINDGSIATLAPRFPDGSSVAHGGVFGNVQWRLGDRHSVSAGARYSNVRIDLPDGTTIEPARLSGDLGWVFDFSDAWQLIANAGAGFRAPNIADLGTLGSRPGNRFNIPNTSLDAESVTHGDLGLRHRTDGWRFELLLFALRYADRIVSVSTGNQTPDGRDIVQSVNAASSSIRGVEAGMSANLTDRISVNAVLNYTFGDQRVADVEEPADRIPPLSGRITLNYAHNERWGFETWLVAATNQDRLSDRDVRDVRINPLGTPGWAYLGASATWSAANWQLSLGIDNLFDRQYRAHGSGIDAPGRNVFMILHSRW